MKKTIKQIVSENKDKVLACGSAKELYQLAIELGFNNRSAFPRFKSAILEICGVDFDAVKQARRESIEASISQNVTHEITLYTDFKMRTDKFAIVDGAGEVVGYGKSFEELEQSQGELFAALRALDVAASAKRNAKLAAIRLNLFVDAQWLTSLSGKAAVLSETARRFGIELNIQWIEGRNNPADEYTTASGFAKIEWTTTGSLVKEICAEKVEIYQTLNEVVAIVESQNETATTPSPAVVAPVVKRSDRGPEFQAWFDAHQVEWLGIKDAWKAEGLTSRERDDRLKETVTKWAAENFKVTA